MKYSVDLTIFIEFKKRSNDRFYLNIYLGLCLKNKNLAFNKKQFNNEVLLRI